ncbi:CNNM transmembrane domain-containing protein [Plasmodiophora brassicae]|uniref:CNNM transmembrane domain-containing protein n=1 Tax=Plasmodiophora brassicae TaxID=37360 RepID=A0A0G4IRM2_PLABS|nr:hypothetical protein PBRA_005956 [Plasmodiophora brassicae]SPQ98062.1 unnamed protein product [Plasmodiophora brassicae]
MLVDTGNAVTDKVAEYAVAVILLVLSAIFSGLNLGLLGLNVHSLEIALSSGSVQAKYAAYILPIRRKANLLLCTLLFGNVAVNAALSILLTDLVSEVQAFILSTSLIVFVGEIVPQAVCSRYALYLGYMATPLVWGILFLLYPICKPVSMILDWLVGPEFTVIYNRNEMRKLVELHHEAGKGDGIQLDEFNIMTGALQYAEKRVAECMTPIDQCFTLDASARLDHETVLAISDSGYSRIPIMDVDPAGHAFVCAILYAKDLILVDPDDALPVRHVIALYNRPVTLVYSDCLLKHVFRDFKTGSTHIAIVVDVDSSGPGDPFYVIRGLITLEDIAEEIFQQEIMDEKDHAVRQGASLRVARRSGRSGAGRLEGPELDTVFHHLRGCYPALFLSIPEENLRFLLSRCPVVELDVPAPKPGVNPLSLAGSQAERLLRANMAIPVAQGGLQLCKAGQVAECAYLILDGKVQVLSGSAQQFESTLGRWSALALCMLGQGDQGDFVPDFTAAAIRGPVRLVRIDRGDFRRVSKMTRDEVLAAADHAVAPSDVQLASTGDIQPAKIGSQVVIVGSDHV